jgi:hypothetical protein
MEYIIREICRYLQAGPKIQASIYSWLRYLFFAIMAKNDYSSIVFTPSLLQDQHSIAVIISPPLQIGVFVFYWLWQSIMMSKYPIVYHDPVAKY